MSQNFWHWLKINFKVTSLLLFINVAIYLITYLFSAFLFAGNDSVSLSLLGAQILPGSQYPFSDFIFQPWRFITSSFLHGGLIHLLFNMWALNSLGFYIEKFYGGKKLFLIYIFTAITSAIASFVVAFIGLVQNNSMAEGVIASVGASGSIFGFVGVLLGNKYLKNKTYESELNLNANSLWMFVGINIFLGFSFNFMGTGIYVNNWAHLGGLLGGIIIGAILNTVNSFDVSKLKKFLEITFFYLAVILFLLAFFADIIFIIINFINF